MKADYFLFAKEAVPFDGFRCSLTGLGRVLDELTLVDAHLSVRWACSAKGSDNA